jgi:hypothetical protein
VKTTHFYETAPIPELYTWFAEEAAPTSPAWQRVCRQVAASRTIQARLDALPGLKRQPNLFLAALKYLGGPLDAGEELEVYVEDHWADIEALILTRRTQTNEVGRCAVLAPVLASLPQPIALIEVGMSAGVCLALDRYGYRWTDPAGTTLAEREPEPGITVRLECVVTGPSPASGTRPPALAVPGIAWRAGIDLDPIDSTDPDSVRWLRSLVWPGEESREARLVDALRTAATTPMLIVRGDGTAGLSDLVEAAPPGATVVVMHSAVLAYLDSDARLRHVSALRDLGVHWVTNEGARVVPGVADQVAAWPVEPRPHFVLALDGVPLARVGSHGAWLDWRSPGPRVGAKDI